MLLQSFGVGAAAVGTTLSAYALARLCMNIPSGILADSRGRKPLLVWGPAITALGTPPGPNLGTCFTSHRARTDLEEQWQSVFLMMATRRRCVAKATQQHTFDMQEPILSLGWPRAACDHMTCGLSWC